MRSSKHRAQNARFIIPLLLLITTPTLYLLLLASPPQSTNAFLPTTRPHLTTFLNHLHPSVTSLHRLASLKPSLRADALAIALSAWRHSKMPPAVLIAAAVSTPKLLVSALFRQPVSGVIDVGAGNGRPVTAAALQQNARWVFSFEQSAKYKRLTRLKGAYFHHIRARPGDGTRHPTLLQVLRTANLTHVVHKRNDPSARMYGTISLLSITLHHPHTVVRGAAALLPSVKNILLRLDVNDHTADALHPLFQSGFECAHLAFPNRRNSNSFFGRNSISASSLPSFLLFVSDNGGLVDVFCSRRPSA
ncbi:unnamed protein product [Agarophyton chilense]